MATFNVNAQVVPKRIGNVRPRQQQAALSQQQPYQSIEEQIQRQLHGLEGQLQDRIQIVEDEIRIVKDIACSDGEQIQRQLHGLEGQVQDRIRIVEDEVRIIKDLARSDEEHMKLFEKLFEKELTRLKNLAEDQVDRISDITNSMTVFQESLTSCRGEILLIRGEIAAARVDLIDGRDEMQTAVGKMTSDHNEVMTHHSTFSNKFQADVRFFRDEIKHHQEVLERVEDQVKGLQKSLYTTSNEVILMKNGPGARGGVRRREGSSWQELLASQTESLLNARSCSPGSKPRSFTDSFAWIAPNPFEVGGEKSDSPPGQTIAESPPPERLNNETASSGIWNGSVMRSMSATPVVIATSPRIPHSARSSSPGSKLDTAAHGFMWTALPNPSEAGVGKSDSPSTDVFYRSGMQSTPHSPSPSPQPSPQPQPVSPFPSLNPQPPPKSSLKTGRRAESPSPGRFLGSVNMSVAPRSSRSRLQSDHRLLGGMGPLPPRHSSPPPSARRSHIIAPVGRMRSASTSHATQLRAPSEPPLRHSSPLCSSTPVWPTGASTSHATQLRAPSEPPLRNSSPLSSSTPVWPTGGLVRASSATLLDAL